MIQAFALAMLILAAWAVLPSSKKRTRPRAEEQSDVKRRR